MRVGFKTRTVTTRAPVNRIAMIEMVPPCPERALDPFPAPVRTLDAIHLAAIEFIRAQGASVQLASYDERMLVPHASSEFPSGTGMDSPSL